VRALRHGPRVPPSLTPSLSPAPAALRRNLCAHAAGPSGQAYLDQDPREALLKYAEEVDANPTFTGIYKETQPTPIFNTGPEPCHTSCVFPIVCLTPRPSSRAPCASW